MSSTNVHVLWIVLLGSVASCAQSGNGSDVQADGRSDATDSLTTDSPDDAVADAMPDDSGDAADAEAVATCDGEPIRCGTQCCTPTILWHYWDEHRWDFSWGATTVSVYPMIGVVPSVVDMLPSLEGWTYRADGSEILVSAVLASERWALECANWCWPNQDLIYIVDASSDELLHVERISRTATLELQDRLRSYPQDRNNCPRDAGASYNCAAVDVPERNVSFVFFDPFRIAPEGDEELVAEMPWLRCALHVMNWARTETLHCIDLYVLE